MINKEIFILKYLNEIKNAAEMLIKDDLPELREEDFFLFKKTGNRLIYEGEYFGRRKFLTVFGIVLKHYDMFVTKTGLDISRTNIKNKLEYILNEVIQEKFWALPAHVNFDTLDENTVDLFASETAGTLAEFLYEFKDELDVNLQEKIKAAVTNRVLRPFYETGYPYSWWEYDKCNWSAVCAGSVGMATIYMDRIGALDKEWKKPILDRVCNALKCYLDGMEDDGACTEGLGYFSYGMSYYTGFANLYKEEAGIDLMDIEKVRKIACFQQKCYFGGGISLSFSDGGIHENFLPGLTAYLKSNFTEVEIPDYTLARGFEEDACYRWLTNERNISWLLKYDTNVSEQEKEAAYYLLPSAQWMIMKDAKGNGLAAKGGHNAENHNHNDVGSFLCVYNGEMLLSDFGAGEYTKDYFNDGRYTILCNRSLGHSVPLINDGEQLAGEKYKADSFAWNESEKTLSISYKDAYEEHAIDKILRELSLNFDDELKSMTLKIADSFKTNGNTKKITEALVSFFKPEIENDNIVIKGNNGKCIISGMSAKPEIIPCEHSLHDGKKVTVYLIHWDLNISDSSDVNEKIELFFTV